MPSEARGDRGREGGLRVAVHYVYFLRSCSRPNKTYVGMTADVDARLGVHNAGGCPSTARFRPWELIAHLGVRDATTAAELERYFKTGSGHAFWHKRFMPSMPDLPLDAQVQRQA